MSSNQEEPLRVAPAYRGQLDSVRDGDGSIAIFDPGRVDAWLQSELWFELGRKR